MTRGLVTAIVSVVTLAVTCALAPASTAPPLLIILHSYDPGSDWTHDVTAGVIDGFAAARQPVDVREEYLDSRHDVRPEYQSRLVEAWRVKYERARPTLLIVVDDAALAFVLTHPEAFGEVPVVFGGVENAALAASVPRQRVTGVREEFRLDHVVDAALAARPAATRLFIVSANTSAGAGFRSEVARAAARRPRLQLVELSGATLAFPQIIARLAAESTARDIVITTPVTLDAPRTTREPVETVNAIARASRAPVFGVAFGELGQGVLATTVSTGYRHGQRLAAHGLRVLRGTSPAAIPIDVDSDVALAYDWRQLRRWGIPEHRVPDGARVLHRPPSLYAEHRVFIWTTATFMTAQAAIIAGLIVNVRRRRRAEGVLASQARALAASNHDLEAANRSLVQEREGRREAEERLRHAAKMEAVGRLAGGVAHDFNNLLTVIMGYSALLIDRAAAGSLEQEGLVQIRRASEQAATLTRNLLAFSRRKVRSPKAVPVAQAIADLEPMLRRFCGERITLSLDVAADAGVVELEEGQLEQVLINLVINACDAMAEGGGVWVTAATEDVGTEHGAAAEVEPGRYAVITVRDTGHGMDAETRARVFEPFFTTKGLGHGTGLGLATVYAIVTQHGGGVAVSSAPGQGATFMVRLPVGHATPDPEPPAAASPASVDGLTILLVEDEAELRALAATVLRRAGYRVLEAPDGTAAIEIASRAERIDLLLTDMVMPGPDGFAVAHEIRRTRPGLAVSYMSGYADVLHRQPVPDDTPLLEKPFMPDALLAHVALALGTAGATPPPSH